MECRTAAPSWASEEKCGCTCTRGATCTCGGVVHVAVEGARGPASSLRSPPPLLFGGCSVGPGGAAAYALFIKFLDGTKDWYQLWRSGEHFFCYPSTNQYTKHTRVRSHDSWATAK